MTRRKPKIDVRLSIISTGGVLGLEDLMTQAGKYSCTVTCTSDKAHLYYLSAEDFYGSFFRHV